MEGYLINLHDFESRKIPVVAIFRCSNHILMTETGRHKKIVFEERMCKMCSQKRVEDERHFLLECPAYNKVRKSLLKHVDPNEDDLNNQFIQLVASSNQNVIYDIARYFKRAFKIRIPLGVLEVGTGVAGFALGVAALPVLEGVCVRGDWFPLVKSLADKFLVFIHCLSGFWLVGIGFSVRLRFLVWVVWLSRGWPGLPGGDLGCHLSSLCLVLCGRL